MSVCWVRAKGPDLEAAVDPLKSPSRHFPDHRGLPIKAQVLPGGESQVVATRIGPPVRRDLKVNGRYSKRFMITPPLGVNEVNLHQLASPLKDVGQQANNVCQSNGVPWECADPVSGRGMGKPGSGRGWPAQERARMPVGKSVIQRLDALAALR